MVVVVVVVVFVFFEGLFAHASAFIASMCSGFDIVIVHRASQKSCSALTWCT